MSIAIEFRNANRGASEGAIAVRGDGEYLGIGQTLVRPEHIQLPGMPVQQPSIDCAYPQICVVSGQ